MIKHINHRSLSPRSEVDHWNSFPLRRHPHPDLFSQILLICNLNFMTTIFQILIRAVKNDVIVIKYIFVRQVRYSFVHCKFKLWMSFVRNTARTWNIYTIYIRFTGKVLRLSVTNQRLKVVLSLEISNNELLLRSINILFCDLNNVKVSA